MLVYRQRKMDRQFVMQPPVPTYWTQEIERIRQEDSEMRQNYASLRNQFDITLYDANTFFDIAANNFVSIRSEEEIKNGGQTVRLEFTDSVAQIWTKVRATCQISESTRLNLIEVSPL